MNKIIYNIKRLVQKNKKRVFGIILSVALLLISPLLILLKVVFRRTLVTCRINARYFGHLGFNAAIASAYASKKNIYIVASFIQPVVNTKLKEAAEKSLHIVSDKVLNIFEKVYYVIPDVVKCKLSKFIHPIIDDGSEVREFIHFSKLASDEGNWKYYFWRSISRSPDVHNTGILVALRTSDFHGISPSQMFESYRNVSPNELACVLVAALNNSSQLPVTFYGSQYFFERLIEIYPVIHNVLFVNQAHVDVLDLFPSAKLIINNGNGIGAVAAAANAKVLYLKHSPWTAWHTFHSSGLVIPALYSNQITKSYTLKNLCEMALRTSSALPLNYKDNFLSKGIELKSLSETDIPIISSSIEEAIYLNNIFRKSERYNGISYMYSSDLEKVFWRAYIDNIPEIMRGVHSDIRVSISSSFLSSNFST